MIINEVLLRSLKMSLKATYFLLQKDKFEEFCKKKHLVPGRSPTIEEDDGKGPGEIRVVTQREMKSAAFRKKVAENQKVWTYFEEFMEVPFKLKLSGAVISDLVYCLRTMTSIDLTEHSLVPEGGGFDWWVIDEKQKAKLLKQLKPSKFSEDGLRDMYFESMQRGLSKQFEKSFGKKSAKEILASYLQRLDEDFPERGEAMLDAVKGLYKYVERVDENTVFMLTVYH